MPDTTPPSHDDPFADLFGKLPDPRARATPAAPESGAPADAPPPKAPAPAAPAPSAPPAPLSRRAAREAASADTTSVGDTPTAAAPQAASTYRASAAPLPPASESAPLGDDALPARTYARTGTTPAHGTPTVAPAAAASSEPSSPAAAGSLDDLFSGATSTREVGATPARPAKRKRRAGGWIAFGIVVVLLGGLAAGGVYVWTTYEEKIREFLGWEEPADFEEGLAHGEALITIVTGDNGRSISDTLYAAGVTKTQDAFYDYLIDEDLNPPFVPGLFSLQLEMTSPAALAAILDPANRRENSALLREGLTVEQSLVVLSETLDIPLEDFQAAVADPTVYGVPVDPAIAAAGGHPLEGWLFPATYTFDPGVTATDVIGRLVNQTTTVLGNLGVPEADRERVLTIASIIQREARYEEDMQKVARVIQNRLDPAISDTNGLLQMDSTAQFGYGEMHDGTASSSGEALRDQNPWNTYVHPGLPVGPISNPGEAAIFAALNPADGDWQYFVTVNLATGETVFTSNMADHERAVAQWQQWCRDNPDGGC